MTISAKEIASRLAASAESTAAHLLPQGRRSGGHWEAGSVYGEAGKSLRVALKGDRRGVWSDFSTGNDKGDLLDLWAATRKCTIAEAMDQASRYLGVARPQFKTSVVKVFDKPRVPTCIAPPPKSAVHTYLTNERKLTAETIASFKVAEEGRNIVFPFKYADELKMCKTLSLDRSADGKKDIRLTSANQQPSLFGWQALDPQTRTVTICEGEIDAMSLHQLGHPALSVPFGAGGGSKQDWIEHEYDHLQRFDKIYICFDPDGPGKEAVDEVVKRLGRHRCLVVDVPADVKDPNGMLQEGWDKQDVEVLFNLAKRQDPERLRDASTYVDEVIAEFYPDPDGDPGFHMPWPKTYTQVKFRSAEISLIGGTNGHGKSQGLGHIVLDAMNQGKKVCIASMEMKPAKLLTRMIKQAQGRLSDLPSIPYIRAAEQWFSGKLWLFDVLGNAKQEELFETFKYARQCYGIDVFVIDSLLKCGIGEDDYNGQKLFVEKLCDFKNEYDCHIFLVAHTRKSQSENHSPDKMDVRGSGAITDLVDNVFIWWRNKPKEAHMNKCKDQGRSPDPSIATKPDAVVYCNKQRNGDWEGGIGLWFDKQSYQFLEFETKRPRCYVEYSCKSETAV